MSIIVEDGTGLASAETLISVAEADSYHIKRGNAAWAALSLQEKEQCLRKANDYLRQTYRHRWKGYPVSSSQGCDWPREGVEVDGAYLSSSATPLDVKQAISDLALKSLSATLNPDQAQRVKREKLGPLETEYSEYSSPAPIYSAVEQILIPYLNGGKSSVPLVRG